MTDKRVLICGVNWLGDSVMTLPAVRAFKQAEPDLSLHILVKAKLAALWQHQPDIDEILLLESGWELLRTVRRVRERSFASAFILPNSFRSALVPFLAGVPVRRGVSAQHRTWMLTDVVDARRPPPNSPGDDTSCFSPDRQHQAWEYIGILGLDDRIEELPPPVLETDSAAEALLSARFGLSSDSPYAVLAPGAARGPSKQWPWEYFVAVGRALTERHGMHVVVSGTGAETELCAKVAADVGENAISLAGRTSLEELVALLGMARVAVTNDSGGMHLAAAAGCPVVAVFGLTDPAKTGPIGPGHRVVTREGVPQSRDIPRHSTEAIACLRSIRPEQVIRAAEDVLVLS